MLGPKSFKNKEEEKHLERVFILRLPGSFQFKEHKKKGTLILTAALP